jgi:glycolate oxidase iron-sulfur subunit
MCHAVCPVFAETGREADVARGKLALLDGLLDEMFTNPEGVFERLNRCLLCGSCASICPRGVNILEIFIKARTILVDFMGLSWRKKIILRGMLARPGSFDRKIRWMAAAQKIFNKPAGDHSGTSCARYFSPLLRSRHFVPLAQTPFHSVQFSLKSPAGSSGIRAAFFTGCLIDKIFPNIARATVDSLEYHEVGIFLPESQGCCGMPAIAAGDRKTFHQLVRYNIKQFSEQDFDYLLTSCATCTFAIKRIWPMIFPEDLKVKTIAEKTMDINQFFISEIGVKPFLCKSSDAVSVTYHDPCHLKKSLGISVEPRMMIQTNPDYSFTEMSEPDRCCGFGGSFNLQYYEISTKIGNRKIENIKVSEASVVTSGCPACMLQLSSMLSQAGCGVVVKHPVEIYAEFITKWSNKPEGL